MADYHRQGNLGFSASGNLTLIAVTRANILTSVRSTVGYPFSFIAEQNALLPLMNFIEDRKLLSSTISENFVWPPGQDLNLRQMALEVTALPG